MRGGGLQPHEMTLEQMEAEAPLPADGLDQLERRIGLGEEMRLQQALLELGVGLRIGDDARADAHLAAAVRVDEERADGDVELAVAVRRDMADGAGIDAAGDALRARG